VLHSSSVTATLNAERCAVRRVEGSWRPQSRRVPPTPHSDVLGIAIATVRVLAIFGAVAAAVAVAVVDILVIVQLLAIVTDTTIPIVPGATATS
jgi:hypothetical protein